MAEYSTVLGFKVDLAPLNQLENQLDKTQAELKNTTAGFKEAEKEASKFTVSAKQQAAAMRGVPAQLTDIVVSLQGGQKPLTVLLQQGGQLKDMFGGVVPAVQALGTQIMALVNPTTLAIAAIAGLGYVIYKLGEDGRQFNDNLKEITANITSLSSSGAFAKTEGQIRQFLSVVADLNDLKVGDLSETFKNIDTSATGLSSSSAKVAVNIQEMSKYSAEAAENYTKLLNSSLANLNTTSDILFQTGYITDEQRKQIDAALKFNDTTTASNIVMEAMVQHSKDQVVNMQATAAASLTVDQMEQKIKQNNEQINGLRQAGLHQTAAAVADLQKQNDVLRDQIVLRKQIDGAQASTRAAAEDNQAKARMEALEKQRDSVRARYGTLVQQREVALATATTNYETQLLGAKNDAERKFIEANRAEELKGINKLYDERDKRANRSAEAAARKQESEAKRLERQYDNIVKRFQAGVTNVRNQGTMDQSSNQLFADSGFVQGNSLQRQYEAAAQAASRMGASIDGAKKSADGLGVSLSFNLNEFAEANKLSDVQKKALEAQVAEAVKLAQANAQANITAEAQARLAIDKVEGERALTLAKEQNEILAKNMWTNEYEVNKLLRDNVYQNQQNVLWEENKAKYGEDYANQIRAQNDLLHQQNSEQEDATKKLGDQRELVDNFKSGVIDTIGTAFDRLWEGQSLKFGELLRDMAKQLLKSMVLRYLQNGLGGVGWGWSSFMGTAQANGGVWDKGVQKFANGGIVNRATPFGMANGATGVMGEAGPEAILPLTRGPNGKLGVASSGSGGTTVVIGAGAVVVNATSNSTEDAEATAQAIRTLIDTRVTSILKDSMRTGNILNRTRAGNY